jgi:sugar lactone lactonase YvrE
LAEWVLAKGVHEVKLTGDLADPATAVELKWSAGRGVPVAVSPRFLWGGPPGALRGSVYAYGEAPGLMTAPTIDLSTLAPQERLDSVVSWMTIVGATGAPVNLFAMWRGTLTAPTPGQYAFDVDSDGQVSLFIDGRLVGVRGDQGNQPGIPAEVQLEAGDHTIELRFHGLRDPGRLALYWQAPGGLRELIPPSAFRGPRSGVWPPTERPSAPLPDPTLVDSEPSTSPATVATTINGGRGWKEARGVAVLPGGKVVVADTGNKRALVYSPEGTLVSTLGDPGDGASGFDLLADVAVGKDGLIAALDAGSGDVTLWDASGTLQNRLTPDRTGLARSSGIAFGPDGSIYVADTGNSRVVRLSRSGQQLLSYYEANGDFEALEQPTDVAITPGGDVFAVDLRHRVVRFDANGRIVAQYPLREGTERGGSHLAFWGDELAITVPEAGTVELLDLKTEAVRRVRLAGENAPTLVLPVGIATRPGDGTSPGPLYVLDSDSGRVYVLEHAAAGP